jgi:hypothetical protein
MKDEFLRDRVKYTHQLALKVDKETWDKVQVLQRKVKFSAWLRSVIKEQLPELEKEIEAYEHQGR